MVKNMSSKLVKDLWEHVRPLLYQSDVSRNLESLRRLDGKANPIGAYLLGCDVQSMN